MTTTKTIRTYERETLTITKLGSLRWYNTHAYGLTKKVVWQDENGGLWVRMNGQYQKVRYYIWGSYAQFTDTNAVEPTYRWQRATEV